ncbi:MAG: Ig-like domain-containing protein [Firmicutes bacterium]|jgi:hypothetical protein|nr:Ig-like domain-containing protein [Bacillota bacterium]
MKRAGKILSLIVLIIAFSTSLCFAETGTLTLKDTYPKDGATGTAMENMSMKLYFDSQLTTEKAGKVNGQDVVKLYDPDGKQLPIKILYPTKEDGVVLILLDNMVDADKDGKADVMVQSNAEYKLVISGNLVDDEGNALGQDKTITFKTLNQTTAMAVNMGMMVLMFGGMMYFSSKAAKKAAAEEAKRRRDEKVNPYKEAKKTGKSVEEIVEKDQKDKAKRAAKEAAKAAKAHEDEEEWIDINTYRVKTRRPISAGGSAYVTGRKAIAEAKKAEAEARKAAQAHKKRNVKKGKGKKK